VHLAPLNGEVIELGGALELGKTAAKKKSTLLKGQPGQSIKESVDILIKAFAP